MIKKDAKYNEKNEKIRQGYSDGSHSEIEVAGYEIGQPFLSLEKKCIFVFQYKRNMDMSIMFRYSFVWVLFLGAGCAIAACGTSGKTKNKAELSGIDAQEPVAEAITQETTYKPMPLSEEQFRQRVADFTSNDKKFKGKKPCVIDFYADWCRPCRIFAPIFEKTAEKYGDKVNFYKIDVDICKKLATAYNITAIPTLFFFDKNGTLNQMVGVPSEEDFEEIVKAMADYDE